MAAKNPLFWITIILSVLYANGSGEFTIVHSPSSLKFSGDSEISETTVKALYSAALGLSVPETTIWKDMEIRDPFHTPEAVVEISVEGVPSLRDYLKGKTYSLIMDQYGDDTYRALSHAIKERSSDHNNKLVKISLNNDELVNKAFGISRVPQISKKTLSHIKMNIEEDAQFLHELEILKAINDELRSGRITSDNVIDFYSLKFTKLHALSDLHGPKSLKVKEAKLLLSEELQRLSDSFSKVYDGRVLFTVVTSDFAHTRRSVRALAEEDATASKSPLEVTESARAMTESLAADAYADDFAAIFNIILWFGVVITFALIAIVYALMDMDPGRDSIIYRMTSTRMKKDN